MAPLALVILGVQLLNHVSALNFTNHKFYSTNYPVHGYKVGHKYPDRFKQYHGNAYFSKSNHELKPKLSLNLRSSPQLSSGTAPKHYKDHENSAERKGLFHNEVRNKHPTFGAQTPINKSKFVNFVTPKVEQFPRNTYEVTTEKIKEDEERFPSSNNDSDLTIAIDDEEDDIEKQKVLPVGGQHPEHQNPLVYVDSYGKVHGAGGVEGFQYGVVHQHSPSASHYHYTHYKKPTGRVRMQVYRGPTRKLGHNKSYASWGYYVVQPAASTYQDYSQHF